MLSSVAFAVSRTISQLQPGRIALNMLRRDQITGKPSNLTKEELNESLSL